MNKKHSAAFTLIAVLAMCLLTMACTLRGSAAINSATQSILSEIKPAPTLSMYAFMPLVAEPVPSRITPEPVETPSANSPEPITPQPPASVPATEAPKQEPQQEVSVPVLNYHSIGDEPDNTLVLDPDKFAQQMEYLSKEGYTPLSLSDFTLILGKQKPAPSKPVLLTFDDGYADNYKLAMPVLKKYGFAATVFISPGVIGQDDYYVNWQQVKAMHQADWDIMPHGMTHPHLPQLSATKQKEQITEARKQIETQLGTTADVFCYPYGEFNKQTLAILKEEGFRYAFTIGQGRTTSSQSPLQLKRIYVNGKDSLTTWSKKLSNS